MAAQRLSVDSARPRRLLIRVDPQLPMKNVCSDLCNVATAMGFHCRVFHREKEVIDWVTGGSCT